MSDEIKKAEKEFSTTVMPREDQHAQASLGGLGGPGIQIPKNAEEIKEFTQKSNVDPKKLNEEIQKAEDAIKDKFGKN